MSNKGRPPINIFLVSLAISTLFSLAFFCFGSANLFLATIAGLVSYVANGLITVIVLWFLAARRKFDLREKLLNGGAALGALVGLAFSSDLFLSVAWILGVVIGIAIDVFFGLLWRAISRVLRLIMTPREKKPRIGRVGNA